MPNDFQELKPARGQIVYDDADPVESRVEPEQPEAPETQNDLEARLNALEDTRQESVVAQPEAQPVVQEETQQEVAETQPDEEFQKFASQFETYFGVSPQEFKQQQEQSRIQNDLQTLQRSWGLEGSELNERLGAVKEFMSELSPAVQNSYNSVEGIQILYDAMEARRQRSGVQAPSFPERHSSASKYTTDNVWFTQAEIDSMDNATYERNADKILKAYSLGKVRR